MAAEALDKDPGVTAVLVEAADPAGWFVAGRRPAVEGFSAFLFDMNVTAGTNTKGGTPRFVREVFAAMQGVLGPLHADSYVLVHAVDGDAYGYGGRTQNGRWTGIGV